MKKTNIALSLLFAALLNACTENKPRIDNSNSENKFQAIDKIYEKDCEKEKEFVESTVDKKDASVQEKTLAIVTAIAAAEDCINKQDAFRYVFELRQ